MDGLIAVCLWLLYGKHRSVVKGYWAGGCLEFEAKILR
jgi:hypothetical protein